MDVVTGMNVVGMGVAGLDVTGIDLADARKIGGDMMTILHDCSHERKMMRSNVLVNGTKAGKRMRKRRQLRLQWPPWPESAISGRRPHRLCSRQDRREPRGGRQDSTTYNRFVSTAAGECLASCSATNQPPDLDACVVRASCVKVYFAVEGTQGVAPCY